MNARSEPVAQTGVLEGQSDFGETFHTHYPRIARVIARMMQDPGVRRNLPPKFSGNSGEIRGFHPTAWAAGSTGLPCVPDSTSYAAGIAGASLKRFSDFSASHRHPNSYSRLTFTST